MVRTLAERHSAVPAVYLFIVRAEKIFLLLRRNTGYMDGYYCVPAGHVEPGGMPTEAIIREAKEEAGITVMPEGLDLVHVLYRGKRDATGDRTDYFFSAKNWAGEPENCEPEKCVEAKWFPLDQLPDNWIPYQREAFEKNREGIVFTEIPGL